MPDLLFEDRLDIDEEEEFNVYLALEQYRDLQMELSQFNNRIKLLKKQITEHVRETGEVIEIDGARIIVSKGYTRTVVNTKPFLAWCEKHPHSEAGKFAIEKDYAPGIRIKVGF